MPSIVSESVSGKYCGNSFVCAAEGLGSGGELLLLGLPEFLRSELSLGFEVDDELLLSPSVLSGEITENAGVSVGFHSENLEGLWDDHSLLVVIWEWDSFENLQSVESGFTSW